MSRWPEHTPQGRLLKAVRERDAEALRGVVADWEHRKRRKRPDTVSVAVRKEGAYAGLLWYAWSVNTPEGAWVLSVLKEGE